MSTAQNSVISDGDAQKLKSIADAADSISSRVPATVALGACGREVAIYKCKVKNIGLLLGAIYRFLSGLKDADRVNIFQGQTIRDPVGIMLTMQDSSSDLLAIATDLSELSSEEVSELELLDYIDLLQAIWELNRDFFSNELPKRIRGLGMLVPQQNSEPEPQEQK